MRGKRGFSRVRLLLLVFVILAMSSYALPSFISIWDDTDLGKVMYPYNMTYFYANYTNSTGDVITGMTPVCNITIINTEGPGIAGPIPMQYNAVSFLYEYNNTFDDEGLMFGPGIHDWNVSCAYDLYDYNSSSDTVNISGDMDEIFIEKYALNGTVYEDEIVTFILNVTNFGMENYTDLFLVDEFNISYLNFSASTTYPVNIIPEVNYTSGEVEWMLNLSVGHSFVALVNFTALQTGNTTNYVYVKNDTEYFGGDFEEIEILWEEELCNLDFSNVSCISREPWCSWNEDYWNPFTQEDGYCMPNCSLLTVEDCQDYPYECNWNGSSCNDLDCYSIGIESECGQYDQCYWDFEESDCDPNCTYFNYDNPEFNESSDNIFENASIWCMKADCDWNGSYCIEDEEEINISVNKILLDSNIYPGDTVQFMINITNVGDSGLVNIWGYDDYNDTFMNFTGISCGYMAHGSRWVQINFTQCVGGGLPPGESVAAYINFTALESGSTFNNVSVNATDFDMNNILESDQIDFGILGGEEGSEAPCNIENETQCFMRSECIWDDMMHNPLTDSNGYCQTNCSLLTVEDCQDYPYECNWNGSSCNDLDCYSIGIESECGQYDQCYWDFEESDCDPNCTYFNYDNPEFNESSDNIFENASIWCMKADCDWNGSYCIEDEEEINISVNKILLDSNIYPGDTVQFMINITNVGDSGLVNIWGYDDYNDTFMNFTGISCGYMAHGSRWVQINFTQCVGGGLPPGESVAAYINFTALESGSTFNNVSVNATDFDMNNILESDQIDFAILGGEEDEDNVTINKTVITPSVEDGSIASFMITVNNNEPYNITNYEVYDFFNTSMINYTAASYTPEDINYTMGRVIWVINNLENYSSFSFNVNFSTFIEGNTTNYVVLKNSTGNHVADDNASLEITLFEEEDEGMYDFGDAPDSCNHFGTDMETDPSMFTSDIIANYPTVHNITLKDNCGKTYGPCHDNYFLTLGSNITLEQEADKGTDEDAPDNNIQPSINQSDFDSIGTSFGMDDGLDAAGIDSTSLNQFNWSHCENVTIPVNITVIGGPYASDWNATLNIWIDYSRNGQWGSPGGTEDYVMCGMDSISEWVVQNEVVAQLSGGGFGPGSFLHNVTFMALSNFSNYTWMRLQVTPTEVDIIDYADGSGPAVCYEDGETEDYYVKIMPLEEEEEEFEENVTIEKTALYSEVENGSIATFMINVTNYNDFNITDYVIYDFFNTSMLNYTAASYTQEDVNYTEGRVVWVINNLPAYESFEFSVNFTTLMIGNTTNEVILKNSTGDYVDEDEASLDIIMAAEMPVFNFNGTVYDDMGNTLSGANVSVDVWNNTEEPIRISVESTLTDGSGEFNIALPEYDLVDNYIYKTKVYFDNGTHIFVSKAPMSLLKSQLVGVSPAQFHMTEGTKLNISLMEIPGESRCFMDTLKDGLTGVRVGGIEGTVGDENENTSINFSIIYVPTGRDYSLRLQPCAADPFSRDISASELNPNTVTNLQYNYSQSFTFVSGYVNGDNFDTFHINNFAFEADAMIKILGPNPSNSASESTGNGLNTNDTYDASTGFFNISLPGKVSPGANVFLFFVAENSSGRYAAFRNYTINYNQPTFDIGIIDLYKMQGYAADRQIKYSYRESNGNITQKQTNITEVNISLVDESGLPVTDTLFIEASFEYDTSELTDFFIPVEIPGYDYQGERIFYNGKFTVPVLEGGNIKIKVYSPKYSIKEYDISSEEIAALNPGDSIELNLTNYTSGDIAGSLSTDDIFIEFLEDSPECSKPDYDADACARIPRQTLTDFNYIDSALGLSEANIVVGRNSTGLSVMYVEADLFTSGALEALFDSDAVASGSGDSLEEAWRFGSMGPDIYEHILISMPYNDTFNESELGFNLDYLYDDNWNIIWNVSANGTNVNIDDYLDYSSDYFEGIECTDVNKSAKCYINTSLNMAWIRVPHFSGVGPVFGILDEGEDIENATITKTAVLSQVDNGSIAQFIINITNTGTANITNAELGDEYNISYMNFTGYSTLDLGISLPNVMGNRVEWDVNISVGESVSLIVNFTTYAVGNTTNEVEFEKNETYDFDSDEANLEILVGVPHFIENASLTKTALNSPVDVGSIAQFMINVTNTGNVNLTGYELTDRFNISYMNFTWASQPPNDVRFSEGEVEWVLNVSVGESEIIHVNFTTYKTGTTFNEVDFENSTGFGITESNVGIEIIEPASDVLLVNTTGYINQTGYFILNLTNPIQAAIDSANIGDLINISEGVYLANIRVDKKIEIHGVNKTGTIISAASSGTDIFYVQEDKVNISQMTLTRANTGSVAGIHLHNASRCVVENVFSFNNSYGVLITGTSDHHICNENIIKNNNLSLNIIRNIGIGYSNGYCDDNEIIDNHISFSIQDGIAVSNSANTIIRDNKIYNNTNSGGYAISLSSTTNTSIYDNEILNNYYGMRITNPYVGNQYHNYIYENILTDNRINFYILHKDNIIFNNTIVSFADWGSSNYGFWMDLDAANNTIYNNIINISGVTSLFSVVKPNNWNTTSSADTNIIGKSAFGGNFWANESGGFSVTCSDNDFDGYCDANYVLDTGNIDYFPLAAEMGQNPTVFIENATLTKTVLNSTVANGSIAQFMINVTNTGNVNLTGYELTDRFNISYMNFTWASQPPHDVRFSEGEVEWMFNLSVGSTKVIFVNFTTYKVGNTTNGVDLVNSSDDDIAYDDADLVITLPLVPSNITTVGLGSPCLNHNDYFEGAATSPFEGPVNPDLNKMPDYFSADGDVVYMLANFTYNATHGNCSNMTVTADFSLAGGESNIPADLFSFTNTSESYYCIFNASGTVNMSNDVSLDGMLIAPVNVSFTATDGINNVTGKGRNAVIVNTTYAPSCGVNQPDNCTIADLGGFTGDSTDFIDLAHNGNFFDFDNLTFDIPGHSKIVFTDNVSIPRPSAMQGLMDFAVDNMLINGTIGVNDSKYDGSYDDKPNLTGIHAELTFYNITGLYGINTPQVIKQAFGGGAVQQVYVSGQFSFDPGTGNLILPITSFSQYTVQEAPEELIENATITKTLLNGPLTVGDTAVFMINVTNTGTVNFTEFEIRDSWNSSHINYTASASPDYCVFDEVNYTDSEAFWLLNLSVGDSALLYVNFTTLATGNTTNEIDIENSTGGDMAYDDEDIEITSGQQPINVTLIYPTNGLILNESSFNLNYSVNIESNCTLYINNSGNWTPYESNVHLGNWSVDMNLVDGNYMWNVYCFDVNNISNNAWAETSNFTFVVNAYSRDFYEIDDNYTLANWITTDNVPQHHTFNPVNDSDWFKFNTTAHNEYTIETYNLSGGADTMLLLYDSDGQTYLTYDDDSGPGYGSILRFKEEENKTYYVLVDDYWSSGNSYNNATYSVKVNSSAISNVGSYDSYEYDDYAWQANVLVPNGTAQSHNFYPAGDEDWVEINMSAGASYVIETGNLANGADTYMFLYGPNGNLFAYNDDVDSGIIISSKIEWTANESGLHYLKVRDYDTGASGGTYDISATYGPSINNMLCHNGTGWTSCSNILYGTNFSSVKANCTYPAGIKNVTFSLLNVDDNNYFFTEEQYTSNTTDFYEYDMGDIDVDDSGEWNIIVECTASDGTSTNYTESWGIEWGKLSTYLIEPTDSINMLKYNLTNISTGVTCTGGECQDITATLDPKPVYVDPVVESLVQESEQYSLFVDQNKKQSKVDKIESDAVISKQKNTYAPEEKSVEEMLDEQGEVPVIVVLKDEDIETVESKGQLSSLDIKGQSWENKKEMIKQQQDKVLSTLSTEDKKTKFLFWTIKSEEKEFNLKRKYGLTNAFSGKVTKSAYEKLKNNPDVKSVHYDKIEKILLHESVPLIEADEVWNLQYNGNNITGSGETVCVIDTGVDYNHADLGGCFGAGCKVLGGYDFYNDDANPMDDHNDIVTGQGHGTHCAGIVASTNSVYTGVAPGANIIAMKACDSGGSCSSSDILSGIEWCVANATKYNISVISMSLGGGKYNSYCDSDPRTSIINTAVGQGIMVVAASGNDGYHDGISAPACVQNATAVGSTTKADAISSFSNVGMPLDIYAPGSSITSTKYPGGGFTSKSGTSMATPHVAGAAALLHQYYRESEGINITPQEIEDKFKITGVDVYDATSGITRKRIDVLEAVQDSKGDVSMTPGATPFYSLTQNPVYSANLSCLTELKAGESCNQSWTINATGTRGQTYVFFTRYKHDNEVNITPKFNITILNNAPVLAIPEKVIAEDSYSEFDAVQYTTDTDDENFTYSILTENVSEVDCGINNDNITLMPAANWSGQASCTVKVTDEFGGYSNDTFLINVTPVNDAPYIANAIDDMSMDEDSVNSSVVDLTNVFDDVDNVSLVYSFATDNGNVGADQNGNYLRLTASGNYSGVVTVTVNASDGEYSVTDEFNITVVAVNDAPYVANAISDMALAEDTINNSAANLTLVFGDVDNATLVYSFADNETDVVADQNNDQLRLTASNNFTGDVEVNVTASDGEYSVTDTFVLTVTPVNDAPYIANPIDDMSMDEDSVNSSVVDLTTVFDDVDNVSLVYNFATDNGNVGADQNGNYLRLTASGNYSGVVLVNVTASDGQYTVIDKFNVTIVAVNDAPYVASNVPDVTFAEDTYNDTLDLDNYFNDIDDINLIYNYTSSDTDVSVEFNSGMINITAAANWNGVVTLNFSAYDGEYYVYDDINVTITPVDDVPQIDVVYPNGGNTLFGAGNNIRADVTDVDGDVQYVTFYNSNNSGVNWYIIDNGTTSNNVTYSYSWNVSSLANITTYRINATVYDGTSLVSDASDADFEVNNSIFEINPISNLTISLDENNSVVLDWNPSNSSIQEYRIFVSTDPESFDFNDVYDTTASSSTMWVDTNAINYTKRYYVVRAASGSLDDKNNMTVGKYEKTFSSGWQMVSFPLNMSNWQLPRWNTEDTLENPVNVEPEDSIKWINDRYGNNAQRIIENATKKYWSDGGGLSNLNPVQGYWMQFNQSATMTFIGEVNSVNYSRSFNSGWDMIGVFSVKSASLPRWNTGDTVTNPVVVNPSDSQQWINDRYGNNAQWIIENATKKYWSDGGGLSTITPGNAYWMQANQSYSFYYYPG